VSDGAPASLPADRGERLVAAWAEIAGVILQALRHAPFTHFDVRTLGLEFVAAFAGDISDRADRLLQSHRGIVERVVALP
jgi:hypothetical protein